MAIIEWKGRSGIGGHLDGNLVLASDSDAKVYDDFVKSLRGGQVNLFLIISLGYSTIFYL